MIYKAVNETVLHKIPYSVKHILDIGCGSGEMGRRIKEIIDCDVTGITYSESEALIASKFLDRVLIHDINDIDSLEIGIHDCIICSHILEHLYFPTTFLCKIKKNLTSEAILVVALPNILFWKQRIEFLKGNFKYTDGGLMDRTHFRFFDWQTANKLIQDSGYSINSKSADGYFPLPVIRRLFPKFAIRLDHFATKLLPNFFGFQFVFIANKV